MPPDRSDLLRWADVAPPSEAAASEQNSIISLSLFSSFVHLNVHLELHFAGNLPRFYPPVD